MHVIVQPFPEGIFIVAVAENGIHILNEQEVSLINGLCQILNGGGIVHGIQHNQLEVLRQ